MSDSLADLEGRRANVQAQIAQLGDMRSRRDPERDRAEGRGVVWFDVVQQARYQARETRRGQESCADSGQRQPHALPQHQHHDLVPARTQRYADADLTRPLFHGPRHHSVDPYHLNPAHSDH